MTSVQQKLQQALELPNSYIRSHALRFIYTLFRPDRRPRRVHYRTMAYFLERNLLEAKTLFKGDVYPDGTVNRFFNQVTIYVLKQEDSDNAHDLEGHSLGSESGDGASSAGSGMAGD